MKKLLCLLLCLLLVGCGRNPVAETTGETDPAAETMQGVSGETTVAATEPTVPEPTAPPEPEPTLPREAIREYSELAFDKYIQIQPVNGTAVALTGRSLVEEGGTVELFVMDLATGKCSGPILLEDGQFVSGQTVSGNRFLVEDLEQDRYLVLGLDLQVERTVSVPQMYGYFTQDLSTYYYLSGKQLMAFSTESGEVQAVEMEASMRIGSLCGYDDTTGILLLTVEYNPFGYEGCSCAINVRTGELLLMNDFTGYPMFTGNGVCVENYNPEDETFDYYFYRYGDSAYRKIPRQLFRSENGFTWVLYGSEYIIQTEFDEKKPGESQVTVYRFGETVSVSTELSEQLRENSDIVVLQDGSWLCGYWNSDGYRLYRICPELYAFEPVTPVETSDLPLVEEGLLERYAQLLQGPELSEELAQVRAQADAIEEDFGITVLLSNQCRTPADQCDMPMVTTDQVEWLDEAWYISDALSILRRSLELYPEGFFAQFRRNGSYGLLVLLVEDIQSENNVIGVCYQMSSWYPIAVDITSYDLMSTYCHEIWHATENFISDQDYDIFEGGHWEKMNPQGFLYSYGVTLEYVDETEWTYTAGCYGTQSYFVDCYARTNAKEDRARLMEYVMAFDEDARDMMLAPALYDKVEYMCRAIRSTFDTTGWEHVWWERFHTELLQ